jgi:hypothetical protein
MDMVNDITTAEAIRTPDNVQTDEKNAANNSGLPVSIGERRAAH